MSAEHASSADEQKQLPKKRCDAAGCACAYKRSVSCSLKRYHTVFPLRKLKDKLKRGMVLRAARAMLMKADILLLDEPTNHLDVTNVAWLENYLNNIPEVSSMIVSHDSGGLCRPCHGRSICTCCSWYRWLAC